MSRIKVLVGVLIAQSLLSVIEEDSSWADVRPSNLRVFTFRIRDEPETLDWNRAHTAVESSILMNLMEGLVSFESAGTGDTQVTPALAESWTVSPDGRVYLFHLRRGVKWSDGVALRAQDFVYSWKRLLSPLTAAAYAYFLFDIQGAEAFNRGTLQDFNQVGVKALDDLTLQVTLAEAIPNWIRVPAFWVTFPLRQDLVETYGDSWTIPGRMVSLGPFVLTVHDLNSRVVMRTNALYYRSKGNVDQVVAEIIKEDATAVAYYNAGKLDFLNDLASVDIRAINNRTDLRIFPHLKTGFLGFVVNQFPVSNVKLRRAIAMAIDKKKLVALLHGEQKSATSFVPPSMLGYSKAIGLPYDPALARIELNNSGIDLGASPLILEYLIPAWDKSRTIAEFIKSELKRNIGVDVHLQTLNNLDYRVKLDLRVFPLFDSSWTSDFPDPDNFLSTFSGSSGNNRSNWKNDRFDEGVRFARRAKNPTDRERMYIRLQKLLLEDEAVLVPLYYEPNLVWARSKISGIELTPMDYLYLRRVNIGS